MATRVEKDFSTRLSPEALSKAMRDPALIEKSERSRGALEVGIKNLHEGEERHEYEIVVVNYARSVTGVDTSKTETSTTTVRWDLKNGIRRWTWKGVHAGVHVSGEDRIIPAPSGSRLSLRADVDVSIPLAGRIVEKKVKSGFEENWPKYVQMVEAHGSGS